MNMSQPLPHQGQSSSVQIVPLSRPVHASLSHLGQTESPPGLNLCSWTGGTKATSPDCLQCSRIKQLWKIATNMHGNNARFGNIMTKRAIFPPTKGPQLFQKESSKDKWSNYADVCLPPPKTNKLNYFRCGFDWDVEKMCFSGFHQSREMLAYVLGS